MTTTETSETRPRRPQRARPPGGFGGRIVAVLTLALVVFAAGATAAQARHTIIFFGDSLTEGHGLRDPDTQAFPAIIQQKIDAEHLPWRVVNAGLSGETSAGGLRRVDWILRQPADIFILELGANDGLRGIDPAVTRKNLEAIIARVRAKDPQVKVVLAGMQMPPGIGQSYADAFREIFPAVAHREHVPLIPFLLEGVGGRPDLNQADGIHPTAAGHRIVAENVWKIIRPLL